MKKKIILSLILTVLLIVGSVIIYEKSHSISIIENIKNRINKQEETTNQITTIDITGIIAGKETQHEHIYKTMYDENKHWEECKICGEKRNETAHTITTTWALRIRVMLLYKFIYKHMFIMWIHQNRT